jgi:hypothetical protein
MWGGVKVIEKSRRGYGVSSLSAGDERLEADYDRSGCNADCRVQVRRCVGDVERNLSPLRWLHLFI